VFLNKFFNKEGLLSNLKSYIFLFILLILTLFRFYIYQFPPKKDLHYKSKHLITSDYYIEDEKFIVKLGYYKLVFYSMPSLNVSNSSKFVELSPGDIVYVEGKRYYRTIYAKNIIYDSSSLLTYIYKIKSIFEDYSYLLLPQPHASLLNGMLFGTEPIITDTFKDSLIKSGLIHVIVVSGFNVSLVMGIAYSLFKNTSLGKRFLFGSIFAFIYLVIVGFDPPIIRAVLMGILVSYSQAIGEEKNSIYLLFVVILVLLILQPYLIDSLSLQLTFLATLGIYLIGVPLDRIISSSAAFSFLPSFIKSDISASFSAQLFVMPLLIYKFKRVSLVSLPANFLILWVIPLIMFLGFIYLLLCFFYLLPLVNYFTFILKAPLEFFIDFINLFSSLPYSQLTITLNFFQMIFLYLIIIVCSFYFFNTLWKKNV